MTAKKARRKQVMRFVPSVRNMLFFVTGALTNHYLLGSAKAPTGPLKATLDVAITILAIVVCIYAAVTLWQTRRFFATLPPHYTVRSHKPHLLHRAATGLLRIDAKLHHGTVTIESREVER